MFTNSVRQQILSIERGQTIEFAQADVTANTLRQYTSHLGKLHGRKYHMRTDWFRRLYVVTREA